MVVAAVWSPLAWSGARASLHPHVWGAIFLGALIVGPPAALGLLTPGVRMNRYCIAIAQMLIGSLLIHLTGGRIETHFHVFGSLAFLAFYRDWRVLVTATLVVAADHLARGLFWPSSVYGVDTASLWRVLEHAGWVCFEDVFLVISCLNGQSEMWRIATRHARLEAKSEVERRFAAADAANRAKSEFLANMSHEIRTPMTAIQGYADLLLDSELTVSDRLSHVQTIRRNSDHLLSILNDVLDLSKIEAGKMTVESVDCSPAQILVDVASLMRVRATDKGIGLDLEYQTPIPTLIKSDPTRLRQILLNLVGNAIKFTSSGGVRVLVRCSDPASGRLTFEVADTGLGMTREQLSRLFQPFTQADSSTTRRFGGTGLGLVICQRLAAMLSGEIVVESLQSRGTSFTLSIETGSLKGVPMIADLREAGLAASPAGATIERATVSGAVLLAEDGLDNQLLIATHLRKAGLRVTIVENGRLAVDQAMAALGAGTPFDVILMDMQMPELDGYGATAQLRNRGYSGPIVALTAHAMAGDRDRCLAAGCDDYLTKPIDRSKLIATVARHIEGTGGVEEPAVVSLYADDEDMRTLVGRFVESMSARVGVVRAAMSSDDREPLQRIAHQLKGAAGGYGFPTISTAASLVETLAGDPTGGHSALQKSVDELLRLMNGATSSPQMVANARRAS